MKAYIIYHKVDFDGLFSAWAVKKHIDEVLHLDINDLSSSVTDVVLVPMNYGDNLPDGITYEEMTWHEVYLVDFSLPYDVMKLLKDTAKLTWIDHHISAIKEFDDKNSEHYIDGILWLRVDGTAACKLTYDYLWLSPILNNPAIDETISLLARYDVRDKSDNIAWENEILPFQYAMRLETWLDIDKIELYMQTIENDSLAEIIRTGHTLIKYNKQQRESWMRKSGTIQLIYNKPSEDPNYSHRKVEITWLAVFWPAGGSSQVFESKRDPTIYDVMVYITYNINKKEYAVSLYSDKDNIDCSVIAKSFGGGGHKWAAWFVCHTLPFII